MQACEHLRLVDSDDVYGSLHVLTLSVTLALTRLMLAGNSAPHGWEAGLATVGYVVRAFWTVGYLAAVARRVLLMGQQVEPMIASCSTIACVTSCHTYAGIQNGNHL